MVSADCIVLMAESRASINVCLETSNQHASDVMAKPAATLPELFVAAA
jgi:hypothetical protein